MLVGRFFVIIPALAIAGSLAAKKTVPASAGTFPTHGGLFVGLLVGVILIVGGLTFFPALPSGPIVEHLAMAADTPGHAADPPRRDARWRPPWPSHNRDARRQPRRCSIRRSGACRRSVGLRQARPART